MDENWKSCSARHFQHCKVQEEEIEELKAAVNGMRNLIEKSKSWSRNILFRVSVSVKTFCVQTIILILRGRRQGFSRNRTSHTFAGHNEDENFLRSGLLVQVWKKIRIIENNDGKQRENSESRGGK